MEDTEELKAVVPRELYLGYCRAMGVGYREAKIDKLVEAAMLAFIRERVEKAYGVEVSKELRQVFSLPSD